MKLRIVVIVATAAIIAMIWPAWSFMKDEAKLFEQQQQLTANLLLDSLQYDLLFDDAVQFSKDINEEYGKLGWEYEKAKARTKLERLNIELEIIEDKRKLIKEHWEWTGRYLDVIRASKDSLNTKLDKLQENSDMFLAMRRLIPFHGEKAAVYEEAKNAVKKALKSPATARFSAYTDDDAIVAAKNDSAFIVSSLVDAQNVYGVPIRSRFVAIVKRNNDKYETTGVSFFKKK